MPHGSSRCIAANDRPFIAPRMRRFTASSTPNTRHKPRKCRVSAAGHTHGKSVTKVPIRSLVSHPVGAPTSTASGFAVISGWRISPPIVAARAIIAVVRTANSRTVATAEREAREFRRLCHRASHAIIPVTCIPMKPHKAAASCVLIASGLTPESPSIASSAATPVRYTGSVNSATPNSTSRLA